MESTTSSDGRVTFTLAPEDDYSGRIMLPNGTELKMPAHKRKWTTVVYDKPCLLCLTSVSSSTLHGFT